MEENILYTGIVESKKETKNGRIVAYKIHNSATPRLFIGLCYALVGNSVSHYTPKYLDCIKDGVSVLNQSSRVVGTFVAVNDTPTARFVSQISSFQVNGTPSGSGYELVLLDDVTDATTIGDRVLAKIPIDGSTINLGSGTVLSIEWNMTFDNDSVSENNQ